MYSPELLHPLVRVRDSVEVFGKAGRGNQVINLAMLRDDLTEGGMDIVGRGDIAVVCGRRRLSCPVGISRGRTVPSWDSPFGSLLLALWLGARLPPLYRRKQISSCSYGT